MDKMINLIIEKYEDYSNEFNENIDKCTSVSEMLHTYAMYTGKLEALLDGLTIGGKTDL